MGIKVTRYENHGKGLKMVSNAIITDKQSKSMLESLKMVGFLRVKGSGIIGMTFEKHDLEKNTQITFERVVD